MLVELLVNAGNWSCAVGKRTPRFPVSYSHGYADFGRNGKRNLRTEVDSEDFDVARAALALAEASQRGGPPASAPSKRVTSSILNGQRKVMMGLSFFFLVKMFIRHLMHRAHIQRGKLN